MPTLLHESRLESAQLKLFLFGPNGTGQKRGFHPVNDGSARSFSDGFFHACQTQAQDGPQQLSRDLDLRRARPQQARCVSPRVRKQGPTAWAWSLREARSGCDAVENCGKARVIVACELNFHEDIRFHRSCARIQDANDLEPWPPLLERSHILEVLFSSQSFLPPSE